MGFHWDMRGQIGPKPLVKLKFQSKAKARGLSAATTRTGGKKGDKKQFDTAGGGTRTLEIASRDRWSAGQPAAGRAAQCWLAYLLLNNHFKFKFLE